MTAKLEALARAANGSGPAMQAHAAAWSPERALAALAVIEAAQRLDMPGAILQDALDAWLEIALTPGDV